MGRAPVAFAVGSTRWEKRWINSTGRLRVEVFAPEDATAIPGAAWKRVGLQDDQSGGGSDTVRSGIGPFPSNCQNRKGPIEKPDGGNSGMAEDSGEYPDTSCARRNNYRRKAESFTSELQESL